MAEQDKRSRPEQSAAAANPVATEEATSEVVKPVEITPIYASSVQMQGAGNDVSLLFRRPRPAQTAKAVAAGTHPDAAILELVAVLTLSPLTAKDLSLLLQEFVGQHEKTYGTINTPFTQKRAAAAKKQ
jgi:hypothetical protein